MHTELFAAATLFLFVTHRLNLSSNPACGFREFVVDLVVEPGSISSPDSSINGQLLSTVPSPFKTSCAVGSGNYTTPVAVWNQAIADERRNMVLSNSQYSGTLPTIAQLTISR